MTMKKKKRNLFKRIFNKAKIFFVCIRNYFLCIQYPFLHIRNTWGDKSCGYRYTWYDSVPEGWRKAFGKQLLKELKKILKKNHELKTFRFHQIKEKYGMLRMDCGPTSSEALKLFDKYENISMQYCINCGEKAKYVTDGWIEFLCERCFKRDMLSRNRWKELSPEEESKYLEEHIIKN